MCFKLKPLIILIIQEIAEFVNMLDSLKITENDLRRDGNFDGSDHASFYSYVAEIDSCIVGYSFVAIPLIDSLKLLHNNLFLNMQHPNKNI